VAAPVFQRVAKFLLYRNKEFPKLAGVETPLELPKLPPAPDGQEFADHEIPNFIGLDKKSSLDLARKKSLTLVHLGIGVVTSQFPPARVKIGKGRVVRLIYSPPKYE
jgi:cell division protein FtsI (penicillin-binding protein 3)